MSTTSDTILKAIFPPDGQTIPLTVARNWPAVEHAVNQLAAAMNGEQNDAPAGGKAARTPEWYAARNERIYRIMDENPEAPARELARLAGVSEGVIKNLSRRIHPRNVCRPENGNGDHIVEADEMIMIELKPIEKAEHTQAGVADEATTRNSRIVEKIENAPILSEPEKAETPADQGPKNAEIPQELPSNPPETPVQDQTPTVRESRNVEKISNVLDTANGPKIPHSEDDFIIAQRESGMKFAEILAALRAKGIDCAHKDVENRYYIESRRRAKQENGKPLPPAEKPQSDIVALSRQEIDEWMWKLWKGGMKPGEISEKLVEDGYQYSEAAVRRRLLQQGANL